MIFIISKYYDIATINVCEWLKYYNQDYIVLNIYDVNLNFAIEEDCIIVNSKKYYKSDIKCFWFRRIGEIYMTEFIKKKFRKDYIEIEKFVNREKREIIKSIYSIFSDSIWINNPLNSNLNKIDQLITAKKYNFSIPSYIISNNKTNISNFFEKNEKVIVKPISNVINFNFEKNRYKILTQNMLINDFIKIYGDKISFPLYIQEMIDIKYEIRVFYLIGKIYACAIVRDYTYTDFRRFSNIERKFSLVNIPDKIKNNINDFMQHIKLNCGSIDLILGNNGEYYFLEVNPIGQFGMISEACNLNLYKELASVISSF